MMRHIFQICAFLLMILFLTPTTTRANSKVLVIPKGSKATFWKIVSDGALKAGKDLGISVTIRGPHTEDKHHAQINIVDYGVKQNFDAIVLAPNHVNIVAPALKRAVAKGIKVVLIDSDMTTSYHASLVESDNYRAGQMAADHLASLVGSSGNIILARHIEGHASTQQREKGFLDTITSHYPNMQVIADPYVGASRGEAYHTISSLLRKQSAIDAIFSVGEEATLGTLRALKDKNYQPKIKFIGFDFNTAIRNALLHNEMDATIVQKPFHIGYLGVEIANQLIQNEKVAAKVNTDIVMVTRENIHTAKVQEVTTLFMQQH